MKASVFTKVFDDRSLEEALGTAADVGFDGVEIMARDPHFPGDTSRERAVGIATLADDLGLEIPCLATYTGGYTEKSDARCEEELERFERFLALSDVLGADIVRHGPGGPSVRDASAADFDRAATWLGRAADLAAEYDKTVGLEIHAHQLTETADSTRKLLRLIDRDNIGVIHDAGNMFIVDDPYGPESLETLADHVVHVHAKDLSRLDDPSRPDAFELETPRGNEAFRYEHLGDGAVDHGPLFAALADRGYDGYVTTESAVGRVDPETVANRDLEEMERLFELVGCV